ncbi:MAG: peptide chain release factor N(5)-glutamine methyltransferase [Pseudomonadota bacterium]
MGGNDDLTLGALFKAGSRQLAEAAKGDPLKSPHLDARMLLARATSTDDHRALIDPLHRVASADADVFKDMIARRVSGEPVARILGEREFFGLMFELNEATLVPRPETETLVAKVLQELGERGLLEANLTIADIGTGSGAIAVALLTELPAARAVATDLSYEALQMARINAARHNVLDRLLTVRTDTGDAVAAPLDVIVANPPYISDAERKDLPLEVRNYDPALALFSPDQGFGHIRRVVDFSQKTIAPDGFAIVEHGYSQSERVGQIVKKAGFKRNECVLDMAKVPRFRCFGKKVT